MSFDVVMQGGHTILRVGTPILLALLVVSVVVGLLQSILQLQDGVIALIPKLTVIVGGAFFAGGMALDELAELMRLAITSLGAPP